MSASSSSSSVPSSSSLSDMSWLDKELQLAHYKILKEILMRCLRNALEDCYFLYCPPCTFREFAKTQGRQHHTQFHAIFHEIMGHDRVTMSMLLNDFKDVEMFARNYLLDAMPELFPYAHGATDDNADSKNVETPKTQKTAFALSVEV